MTEFTWKPPLPDGWADWHKRARTLVDGIGSDPTRGPVDGPLLAELVHRMASCRLGPLEQLRLEKLAERLWPLRDHLAPLRPLKIGLIGSSTLDFMVAPLRAAGLAHLLVIEPVMAPLDTAAAIAHGSLDPFGDERLDLVFLWQDLTAFGDSVDLLDKEEERRSLDRALEELIRLEEGLRRHLQAKVIVPTLVPNSQRHISSADLATAGTAQRYVHLLNGMIAEEAGNRSWLLWDVDALAADIGRSRWFDAQRFFEARTPFALDLNPVVCDHFARLLAAHAGKSRRALVLDLDNTLWGGVIGDDGVEGITVGQGSALGEAFISIQSLALELRRRGVVLAVCSKNDDDVARQPFRDHPDMVLREEHFAVFQAGWEDKATSIKAIAEALRLSPESLVFVDDNPAERVRVRQALPFVAVPELSAEPADYPSLITGCGAFEHILLTGVDLGRAGSYQADARRAEVRAKVGNYDDYLRSLCMTMTVAPFDGIGLPRIAQLISKSNQFNVTTRRHGAELLSRLSDDPNFLCWQARLADTFGDHGMIAVVIVRKDDEEWIIDTWIQSCRVLERGVEQTLMNLLVEKAAAAGARRVFAEYRPTPRNGMVSDLFTRLRMARCRPPAAAGDDGNGVWFELEPGSYRPLPTSIAVGAKERLSQSTASDA